MAAADRQHRHLLATLDEGVSHAGRLLADHGEVAAISMLSVDLARQSDVRLPTKGDAEGNVTQMLAMQLLATAPVRLTKMQRNPNGGQQPG